MKILTFISHKLEDAPVAVGVQRRLKDHHGIDCYLDVLDDTKKNGPELTDYLKAKLRECNNLLAIISDKTKGSWWVPWEIGVASEREYPLATVALGGVSVPEYLRKWPYLQNERELDLYAQTAKETLGRLVEARFAEAPHSTRKSAATGFFSTLSSRLGRSLGT
jgi:hypothetical protein